MGHRPSITDDLSHFSTDYSGAGVSVRSSRRTPGDEMIRTTASNVQIHRVRSTLRQLKDAWVHGGPGDLERHGQKRTNARVRVNLHQDHPDVKRCRQDRHGGKRTNTHLVCLLVHFDDMLPQLLRVLDPGLGLEERLFFRIQFQNLPVEVKGTEVTFGFTVQNHRCREFGRGG